MTQQERERLRNEAKKNGYNPSNHVPDLWLNDSKRAKEEGNNTWNFGNDKLHGFSDIAKRLRGKK